MITGRTPCLEGRKQTDPEGSSLKNVSTRMTQRLPSLTHLMSTPVIT